jgi:hypothetical protein
MLAYIRNDLDLDLVTNVELEEVFGKRGQNGWKPKPNDTLTTANCATLMKLFMPTPLTIGQWVVFSNLFMRLVSATQRAPS